MHYSISVTRSASSAGRLVYVLCDHGCWAWVVLLVDGSLPTLPTCTDPAQADRSALPGLCVHDHRGGQSFYCCLVEYTCAACQSHAVVLHLRLLVLPSVPCTPCRACNPCLPGWPCAVLQVVGGIYAHSLAIITDAAHLLSDVSGFAVAVSRAW